MVTPARTDDSLCCSFCRKTQNSVRTLISSPPDFPRAYICLECIAVCNSILGDDRHQQYGRPVRVSKALLAENSSQKEKANRFRALHDAPGVFIIPNPWDIGSARLLAGLGFQALATSSAAAAAAHGRRDHGLTRDESMADASLIVGATDLPVSADFGKGFGDAPKDVAETVRRAAEAGLVGCTIEDSTGDPDHPLYEEELAVERIAAGVEAARALPFPFILTARAHNFLYPNPSLDDTIRRLQAFENVGADVLFAPGLPDIGSVRAVCDATSKPFNFMAGFPGKSFPIAELASAGIKRISLAASLYRAAMTGFLDAIREVKDLGTFSFLDRSVTTAELSRLMGI
jgi:2-methylisocitrate lyase-like PEP mutase family enzyme